MQQQLDNKAKIDFLLSITDDFDVEKVEEEILKRCEEIKLKAESLKEITCPPSCLKVCCNILAKKEALKTYYKNQEIFKSLSRKFLMNIYNGNT